MGVSVVCGGGEGLGKVGKLVLGVDMVKDKEECWIASVCHIMGSWVALTDV